MALEKLKIFVEERPGVYAAAPVEVAYNPGELKLDKRANWPRVATVGRDTTHSTFTHGGAYTLAVDLFFDSYEMKEDVRDQTRDIARLLTVEGSLFRPPRCKLFWGNNRFDDMQWVLESLSQRFTLFLPGGEPARAILGCSFKEWRSPKEEALTVKRSSHDVAKTRVVKRGESLSSIAAEEYNDPGLWRQIAELNRIHNPRRLAPGLVLAIPPLQRGRRT